MNNQFGQTPQNRGRICLEESNLETEDRVAELSQSSQDVKKQACTGTRLTESDSFGLNSFSLRPYTLS